MNVLIYSIWFVLNSTVSLHFSLLTIIFKILIESKTLFDKELKIETNEETILIKSILPFRNINLKSSYINYSI